MTELGEAVTSEEKTKVEGLIKDLEEALKGEDLEIIKTKKEALEQEAQQLAQRVYQQQQQQTQQQDTNSKSEEHKSDDKTVDAEFEEKYYPLIKE